MFWQKRDKWKIVHQGLHAFNNIEKYLMPQYIDIYFYIKCISLKFWVFAIFTYIETPINKQ